MDKKTIKILNHYAKLAHINKKWVVKAYEHVDLQKREVYLFSIKAAIKLMEKARIDPESIGDRQKFISDFISQEKKLGHELPDFKSISKKDMKPKVRKGKKFETQIYKGMNTYPIPKEWDIIEKLIVSGKSVDFSVKIMEGKEVIVLDKIPRKSNIMTAFVILKT